MRQAVAAVLLGEEGGLLTDKEREDLNALREEYVRWSEEYAAGNEQAGLHMQSLYEQAQALGEAYYESSEWAQEEIDVQLEQIEAIRDNTAGLAAATDAFRLAEESSKGMAAAYRNALSKIEVSYGDNGWYDDGGNYHYTESELASVDGWYDDGGNFHPYAYGLDRVPYNDYPALLHEGERVLTASQARAMDTANSLVGSPPRLDDDAESSHSHAFGLDRVPYNDYPALLHEGERMLSASEARAMDTVHGVDGLPQLRLLSVPAPNTDDAAPQGTDYGAPVYNITISGVTINGTIEDAADQLAEIIVQNLEQAAIVHQPR